MATGDTVPALALSSSPPPLLDHSPSNLSSPLSDVEDKDTEHEGMDLDTHIQSSVGHGAPDRSDNSDSASDTDSESKLSEVDVNDSEAETERLYDTPPKDRVVREILNPATDIKDRQLVDRRDRTFERSPSKLQQQIQADIDNENTASGHNSVSDGEEEDDDISLPSTDPEPDPDPDSAGDPRSRSPSEAKKPEMTTPTKDSTVEQIAKEDPFESRKRKRLSVAEQSETGQPVRKRTGSVGVPVEPSPEDAAMVEDEGGSTNNQSGNHSPEEDNGDAVVAMKMQTETADSIEESTPTPSQLKKSRRGANKKQKSKSPDEPPTQALETSQDELPDTDAATGEDSAARVGEEQVEDADEAEIAQKNEEELERKRAAWEELNAIEKQFGSFRERLYQERLEQLNQEEAMLTCENPTHPDYLAMLQCINERRDERIRVSTMELQLRLSMLQRRAVAERAQILTQYQQGVREAREKVLEELGEEWYDIQQERRRSANAIPDYGIRFPSSKAQTVRNAVAYNKEVSILSGFAKHVGFPAAPAIHGASEEQVESDLEAIARTREPEPPSRPALNYPPPVYHQEFSVSLPFGRNLGPAGEQFIEQTPWANPNHPAHHIQRQYPYNEASISSAAVAIAGPSNGPRRHSNQYGGMFSSSTTTMNGDSPVQIQKAHASMTHDPAHPKGPRLGADQGMKREAIAPAS